MADDPAGTAATNNPELSTLVAAIEAAGLTDTLNGEGSRRPRCRAASSTPCSRTAR